MARWRQAAMPWRRRQAVTQQEQAETERGLVGIEQGLAATAQISQPKMAKKKAGKKAATALQPQLRWRPGMYRRKAAMVQEPVAFNER